MAYLVQDPTSEIVAQWFQGFETLIAKAHELSTSDRTTIGGSIMSENFFRDVLNLVTEPVGPSAAVSIKEQLAKYPLEELRYVVDLVETESERWFAQRALEWHKKNFDLSQSMLKQSIDPYEKIRLFWSPPGLGMAFPRFSNYLSMSRNEASFLKCLCPPDQAKMRVAFGGCGALDLSTDLLLLQAASLGIELELLQIDRDSGALALSQELNCLKECLGVIKKNCKTLVNKDLSQVRFVSSLNGTPNSDSKTAIETDVVFVAAMVPLTNKEQIFVDIQLEHPMNKPLGMITRGGSALVSEILYAPVPYSTITGLGYRPICVSHPQHVFVNDPYELALHPVASVLVDNFRTANSIWCFQT